MEETAILKIKYNRYDKCLELENGDILPLLKACKLCFMESEYLCQENLDERAQMFPAFNEFQFTMFCTLLAPTFMDYSAEAKWTELMKLPTRETFSEKERAEALYRLLFWGILYIPEQSNEITKDYLKLNDGIISKLRKCRENAFDVKTSSPIFDIIIPCDIKEDTLFYNPDVYDSLAELHRYLNPVNFNKLQNHFRESGKKWLSPAF